MKVISSRKTSPPPRKTPRKFTVELTEGEADFILGLLASTRMSDENLKTPGKSPFRYSRRLIRSFQNMLGQKAHETDSFIHSYGEVWFGTYEDEFRRIYNDIGQDEDLDFFAYKG
jgi:hypothetical protein